KTIHSIDMNLKSIERRALISQREFEEEYLSKSKPVIFTNLSEQWPATEKWTFEWLKSNYGHIQVPLYDNDFRKPGKDYLTPKTTKSFGEYLDMIQAGPTDLRMFLFNIFKHAPELVNDFSMPTVTDGFLESFPMMFFGGQGARVDLHYDLDCAAIFITQFQRRKKVILFKPEQSPYLYQHPFTVQSEVRLDAPDFEKHPALKKAEGFEDILEHGETLFMPSLYWHYMEYVEGGFSLSLRRHSLYSRTRGIFNISRHFVVDKGMNMVLGDRWRSIKAGMAQRKAAAALS
ncbi:MAG: cupin-like domain-containing protein, partial [Bacteroidota bacterium]